MPNKRRNSVVELLQKVPVTGTQGSLLTAIDKLLKTIDISESAVMIPTLLRDKCAFDAWELLIVAKILKASILGHSDLVEFYMHHIGLTSAASGGGSGSSGSAPQTPLSPPARADAASSLDGAALSPQSCLSQLASPSGFVTAGAIATALPDATPVASVSSSSSQPDSKPQASAAWFTTTPSAPSEAAAAAVAANSQCAATPTPTTTTTTTTTTARTTGSGGQSQHASPASSDDSAANDASVVCGASVSLLTLTSVAQLVGAAKPLSLDVANNNNNNSNSNNNSVALRADASLANGSLPLPPTLIAADGLLSDDARLAPTPVPPSLDKLALAAPPPTTAVATEEEPDASLSIANPVSPVGLSLELRLNRVAGCVMHVATSNGGGALSPRTPQTPHHYPQAETLATPTGAGSLTCGTPVGEDPGASVRLLLQIEQLKSSIQHVTGLLENVVELYKKSVDSIAMA